MVSAPYASLPLGGRRGSGVAFWLLQARLWKDRSRLDTKGDSRRETPLTEAPRPDGTRPMDDS